MLNAYAADGRGLKRLQVPESTPADTDGGTVTVPPEAVWVDLYRPLDAHVQAVRRLGINVPTLADMEEIEISNRLYREDDADYLTVVLPGYSTAQKPVTGPVTFILTKDRLITVRHHTPRPFETFPERANKASAGCTSPERVFLGLGEEIIARLADLLEGAGRVLDTTAHSIFGDDASRASEFLQATLKQVGRQGELVGRVRLALLTLERALIYFSTTKHEPKVNALAKSLMRDITALEVHSDYLSSRIGLNVDSTMGLINLGQNNTSRILSIVATLFMPATLVASIYGMNFVEIPLLNTPWGYVIALAIMLVSAFGTYWFFKWKKWL